MRIDIVSREYPPNVYGGAGVHVTELARALRRHQEVDVRVRAFDAVVDEAGATGYPSLPQLEHANPALKTLGVDLLIAADAADADLVHSHTWYANFAGHLASLLGDIPHVISAHSLEPLRPWKAEQLGGGYAISSYVEKTAYEHAAAIVAVSEGMRNDILRCYPQVDPHKVKVVHNGIDSHDWQPDRSPQARDIVTGYGIDPDRPTMIFVGRITPQKGLPYLLRAARQLPDEVQLVFCAGAPDTPEIKAEVESLIADLRRQRDGVHWIAEMLPHNQVVALLSHAHVFACPSIYEPLGIVNLEAMACELPVVATRTGGIPEVVVHGQTGWLVDIEQAQDGTGTPQNPATFVDDLAAALREAFDDPERASARGRAGRERAVRDFSWSTIGDRTIDIYREVLAAR